MKKIFNLEQEHVQILEKVKEEFAFTTEAQALRYILTTYSSMKGRLDSIERILAAVLAVEKGMEEKTDILYDAVNTLLIDQNVQVCKPVALLESDVYAASKRYRRDRMAELKQRKDNQH